MNIKFDFKEKNYSVALVSVRVDENGNVLALSSNNTILEKELLKGCLFEEFKSFVKCIFSGSICSDRIDVSYKGKTVTYKVEQLPWFKKIVRFGEIFSLQFFKRVER